MRRLEFRQNRLPFPSHPMNKKLSKGVKAYHQTLSPGHFWGSPFLNRWSASSASFVPLLSSKLWLQLSLLPLCPGSIRLWDFYLPAFVFDIMIRQHLIWSLVLIYFLALVPETNSKEQHTVIRYQQSDFYQSCLTLEFIIPFLTTTPPPQYNIWTQLL